MRDLYRPAEDCPLGRDARPTTAGRIGRGREQQAEARRNGNSFVFVGSSRDRAAASRSLNNHRGAPPGYRSRARLGSTTLPRRTRRREGPTINRPASRLGVFAVEQFTLLMSLSLLRPSARCSHLRPLRPAVVRRCPERGPGIADPPTGEQTDGAGVRSARARGSRGSAPCAGRAALGEEKREGNTLGMLGRREVFFCLARGGSICLARPE